MTQEYIRITPSRSDLAPETVVRQLAGLHGLDSGNNSLLEKLVLLDDAPPVFEFLSVTEGTDEPVEFYYGADRRLDAFEERLRTLYPPTVTFDRVSLDLQCKLTPPVEYSVGEFEELDANGQILDVEEKLTDQVSPPQTQSEQAQSSPDSDGNSTARSDGGSRVSDRSVETDSENARPDRDGSVAPESSAVLDGNEAVSHRTSEPPGVNGAEEELDRTIRARPTIDEVDPLGITWYGQASRREDWMTTLPQFTDIEAETEDHARAPLASLIDQLTRAESPIAFQVLFQRKPDWTHKARERQRKLREGEDRLVDWFFGELLGDPDQEPQSPSNTGRQQRYLDIEGRERVEAIDEKESQWTFAVNMRALSLVTDDADRHLIDCRLEDIGSVFDHLNGPHYRLRPKRVRRGLRKEARARKHTARVRNSNLVTKADWRKTRPDLVLGPAELANFIVVPSATELTMEGGRGSDAEPESRIPLPLPAQHHVDAFTDRGMAIGHGLGEDGTPTEEPMRIPPDLLPFHVARLAKSGAGKSVAMINDGLSLYGQTSGPVFMLDSKGGNFPENYMRAHAERFGIEDLEENVLHFSVPEILPGFAFFDLEPALEDGVRRVDAVQDKADHYEELLKLVMGPERYENSITSPTLIKYLIKAMYDEEYGLENGYFREDINSFTHNQLEQAVSQFHAAGPPDPAPEDGPQSSDLQVAEKLERHLRSNPRMFTNVVSAISNRMDYITEDAHLRRIFSTTESQFDFRELLDEDKVIIFDFGGLRDEAARVLTGVILTELYDAVKRRDSETLTRKPDDYVANLLIDEASSVVVSDTLSTLLEKGREFRLSIELVTQFPEQMKEAGNREVYLNVLNNIGSTLVGKIAVDADIADALSHEAMDPDEFKNRISSLPRGEWIAQLPSPEFGETGPEPFSVEPMSIPRGHPDSDKPLTALEEERFQEALETVHEHTREEYGIAEERPVHSRDAAVEVGMENADDQPLEVAMARAIRAVQITEHVRETNEWIPVEAVDEELLRWIDESDIETRGYDTLPDVRDASSLVEVDLLDDASTVMCRLTAAGEQAAEPDTSSSPTGGGDRHDTAIAAVEQALSTRGFSVQVLDQYGEKRPDAVATHPELEPSVQIEVETTTHTRPAKVLKNLKKAQENERIPIFVVEGETATSGADIAKRLTNILREPRNQLSSGETRLYTTTDDVAFNGGATAPDGVTAVRPATDESRHTRWFQRDGDLVLEDGSSEEHAHLTDIETASKDQFPATYSYDDEAGTYTVFRPGDLPKTYESRGDFEADWVAVKRPFVPDSDLPVADYTDDSYAIAIITEQDGNTDVQLYDPVDETTLDIETFRDAVATGELRLAGAPSVPDPDESDLEDQEEETDEFGLCAFTTQRVVEHEDRIAVVGDVYEAYKQFASTEGYEVKAKNQFTQALREYVDFDRDKKWIDGKSRRCYVGIDLRDADDSRGFT